ncbi:IPT/TIG domain-containing protein [Pedobacter sp. ASV12]|uniref:IPT/TIG domain-containing protein n=1 Tax=Pedobacter sp. ASV12 TaxID=2795120 RepID=UPI0018EDC36E|nr:IPT/TIG domain-containing protein [Pedobacter sp. ASV12]
MKFNLYKSLVFLFFFGFSIVFIACKKGKEEPEQPIKPNPEVPTGPAPVILSLSSTTGSYGDYLSIEGANFSAIASENIVKINNKGVYVHLANPNTIVFAVPKGVGSGPLTVTVNGKTATYPNFTYVKGLLVSRFIGDGNVGYLDGKGLDTRLGVSNYTQLIVDQDDNIYSNDVAYLIRKTTPDATITTLAGKLDDLAPVDGPISTARFGIIKSFAIDKQKNIYLTEENMLGNSIRKISSNGIVSTLIKNDSRRPSSIVIGTNNNPYVLLDGNLIIKLDPSGTLLGTYGPFNLPDGAGFKMLVDSKDNLYFFGNTCTALYKVTLAGNVSVLAGKKGEYKNTDGIGTDAKFNYANDFIIDKDDNIYVLQHSQQDLLRKVSPDGNVVTLYKRPQSAVIYTWPMDDMARPLSSYRVPTGRLARDSKGNFYIWDNENFWALKCQEEL